MPRIEVEGAGTFDVEEGKRLVLAIEEDAGVDILHRPRLKPQRVRASSSARCSPIAVQDAWS